MGIAVPMSAQPVDDEEREDADNELEAAMSAQQYMSNQVLTPLRGNCEFFYGPDQGKYGVFSNFYQRRNWGNPGNYQFRLTHSTDIDTGPSPVEFHDEEEYAYSSAEQAIMHIKAILMGDNIVAEKIMQTSNPGEAKKLGRQVKCFDQGRWDAHVSSIAYAVLYAKFSQNPELMAVLLCTRYAILAEAAPRDCIWGIGRSVGAAKQGAPWRGRNLLGRTLMRVRMAMRLE